MGKRLREKKWVASYGQLDRVVGRTVGRMVGWSDGRSVSIGRDRKNWMQDSLGHGELDYENRRRAGMMGKCDVV